jgi:hypothetical protein
VESLRARLVGQGLLGQIEDEPAPA